MLLDLTSLEFEWDKGNTTKNLKHGVGDTEAEEVFFDPTKVILQDSLHSQQETQFVLLGKTKKDRLLFVVFARRESRIRIISARPLNKKERHLYEKNP